MKKQVICLLAGFMVLVGICRADPVTVDPERAVIVLENVPANPDALRGHRRFEWDAALELQKHLELVTGVKVPIVEEDTAGGGNFPFYVAIGHPEAAAELATGEARWRVSEDGVWMYGSREEAERGNIFAVHDFLERQLGVRWLEPGDEGIFAPWQHPLRLTIGRHSWTPSLQSRRIQRGMQRISVPDRFDSVVRKELVEENNRRVDETNVWSLRMRMGGRRVSAGHSFSNWWRRFGETHPEYFALNKHGKREPVPMPRGKTESDIKICTSNPRVAEQLVKDWLPHKDSRRIVSVGVNDGTQNFCECPDCRALDVTLEGEAWDRHLTDRYVVLANRVARMAREHREDVHVSMYAYMRTLHAPRRERLEPNVIVTLVPYVDPMDPEVVREHFEGWRKMGATAFAFRPNYHWRYVRVSVIPTGIDEYFFDVFQTAYAQGMIAANYDMLMHNWPVTGMTEYILAKAMSEPDKLFSYWEEHYCAGYGGASEGIKEYFRYWRDQVWQKRLHPDFYAILSRGGGNSFIQGLWLSLDQYYETEDFDKTDKILELALEAVHTNAERAKVMQLVRANRHARLVFNAMTADADEKKVHAEELRRFRNVNKAELRLHWGHLGSHERSSLQNATGVIVRYHAEDGERLRHRVWDLVAKEE